MKKISLLLALIIIIGIDMPLISYGQKYQNKLTIFTKDFKKPKQAAVFQSQQRGVQYPHKATVYNWNETGSSWDLNNIQLYTYHPNGKNMFTYTLAPDLSDTFAMESTLYDMYGYTTLEISDLKNGPGSWLRTWGYRSSYSYYSTYKLNSRIDEDWDQAKNNWVMSQKTLFTHNGTGLLTDFVDQDWDTVTSSWINTDKYELIYDGNNKNTEVIEYGWDGKAWQKYARIIVAWTVFNPYSQNEENNIDSMEMMEWDSVNKQYNNSFKVKVVRDANGGYVETDYEWNITWIPTNRFTEKYDVSKNYTGSVNEEWNGTAWEKNFEEDFILTYVSGKVTEKIERIWYQGDPAGVFTNTNKYVYSDFNSMMEKQMIQVKTYPQPFQNYLIVEIPENKNINTLVVLSDLTGKVMITQLLPGSTLHTQLDVSGLKAGSYILSIQTSKGKISKLLVKY
jgi:hypothetical protein